MHKRIIESIFSRAQAKEDAKRRGTVSLRVQLCETLLRHAHGQKQDEGAEERATEITEALSISHEELERLADACGEYVNKLKRIATLQQDMNSLADAITDLDKEESKYRAALARYEAAIDRAKRLTDLQNLMMHENNWRKRFDGKYPEIVAAATEQQEV